MADGESVPTEALLVPAQPVTGTVLAGRYRLLQRVGRGGMADVFAAEDALLTRRVAVKIFRLDLSTDDERRRVHAEMQTLAALQHPGLVTVYDAGSAHEAGAADELTSPYLVMELVDGPHLGQRLADGPLPPAEAARLGSELAATLAYVHARNVVHRDVKPANILLAAPVDAGAPFASKLTDFGIARVVDSTHYTEAGFTVGTANYLSPEQALSAEVGTATDVYSLGLVLVECLTGRLAYPGSGIEAALARLNRPPEIPTSLDVGWQQLLAAATDREPANRPSAVELGAQLRTLAAESLASWDATAFIPTGPAAGPMTAGSREFLLAGAADSGSAASGSGAGSAGLPPAADDSAVRLAPPDEPPPSRFARHAALVSAAVLMLATLVTSGLLLRAGHAGGNQAPGTSLDQSSTISRHSSPPRSVGRSSAAVVDTVSAGSSTVSNSAASTPASSSVPPSVVRSSSAAASSGSASSASTSPTASASTSSSSAAGTGGSGSPSASGTAASPAKTPGKGHK